MNRLFTFLGLVVVMGLLSFRASAQTAFPEAKTDTLEEVIMTATRTARQLSSLPLPATLISKETIKKSGTVRLDEILTEQTGIITVADESGFEGVQIQGVSSDYIMILIDGVPLVGRRAGNFDLSRLTVGNIKQIEVVKGPSSALYGSQALGGVINIITEKPKYGDLSGNVSYRYGTNVQQDMNVALEQGFEKVRYSFHANRFSNAGYDLTPDTPDQTVDPFANYTFSGKVITDLHKDLRVTAFSRLYQQEIATEFFTTDERFAGETSEREWNAHLLADHEWNDRLDLQYEFYATNYNAEESIRGEETGDIFSDSYFNQWMVRPEVRGTYDFKKPDQPILGVLTAGAGYQHESLDRTFFDQQVVFNSQYVYAQYDVDPLKDMNVILGARYDHHSEYRDQFSPKVAVRYEINDHLALKSSVGYGFKAPDFRQLFFDFTNSAVGYTVLGYNVAIDKLRDLQEAGQILELTVPLEELEEPLKAESSVGINLGAAYNRKKWQVGVNLFRNDFENLIDTRIIARRTNGQNVFSYRNFDRIYTTGAEVDASYKPLKNLRVAAGYQLLFAYDKSKLDLIDEGRIFARDPESNKTVAVTRSDYFGLVNRSRHNANLKVFYDIAFAKANINARLLYRSRYALFDTNGNGIIDTYDDSFVDGFVTLNLAAGKTFYDDFDLQVGINNVLNQTDLNIPTQPGRLFFATLNYNF